GPLHYRLTGGVLNNRDNYGLPNFTWFKADNFVRDPARLQTRASPTAALGTYTGGFNVPWTYPDLTSFYLGAVKADGTLLTPSFHREYLFGKLYDPNNPGNPAGINPNWTNT